MNFQFIERRCPHWDSPPIKPYGAASVWSAAAQPGNAPALRLKSRRARCVTSAVERLAWGSRLGVRPVSAWPLQERPGPRRSSRQGAVAADRAVEQLFSDVPSEFMVAAIAVGIPPLAQRQDWLWPDRRAPCLRLGRSFARDQSCSCSDWPTRWHGLTHAPRAYVPRRRPHARPPS